MTWNYLSRIDLIQRWAAVCMHYRGHGRSIFALAAGAALLQVVAGFIPWLAWITWPLIVYSCYQTLTMSVRWRHVVFQLCKKPSVFISLILYGLLGLIIFKGFTEALQLAPSQSLANGGWLPVVVTTLLPYSLAEAIALLFVASCSVRLALDERDPLIILSTASRDLLLAPFSFCALVLTQAIVFVYAAVQLSMVARMPSLATVLGHGPYALMVLAWAFGQPHHQAVTS